MTRTWAASQIGVSVRSTIDGERRDLRGAGEVAIDKGYGDIDWTSGDSHGRELVNDRAIFTQSEAPGGAWVRTESSDRTPTSAFADPLRHLTRLEHVSPSGTAQLDGFEAARYHGTLPVTAANLEGLALTDDDVARVIATVGPAQSIDVTVWVDPHHRIVRIDRSLELDGDAPIAVSVMASTNLTNFGVMLDLESPPSASVSTQP